MPIESITEIADYKLSLKLPVPGSLLLREIPETHWRGIGLALPPQRIDGSSICQVVTVGDPVELEGNYFPFEGNEGDLVIARPYDGTEIIENKPEFRIFKFSFVEAIFQKDVPWDGYKTGNSLKALSNKIVIRKDPEVRNIGRFQIPEKTWDPPASGVVYSIGAGRKLFDGSGRRAMDYIKVGDRVVFRPYSGFAVNVNGENFQIIPEIDLLGKFTSETEFDAVNHVNFVEVLPGFERGTGKLALPDTAERKRELIPERARVIKAGPGAKTLYGKFASNPVAVGDVVYFPRLGGTRLVVDGKRYIALAGWDTLVKEG